MKETSEFTGLSDKEVAINRLKFGANITLEKNKNPFWSVLLEVVSEPLFIILSCTALIYFLLGEYNEGIIMIVALCFISTISLYQENKSRNAVDSLKKLSSPYAKVIRNGVIVKIDSEDIVVNDLIVVEDGNIVPADATILKENDFSVNESILTGESLAVTKDLFAPNNIIFQGSTIMSGSCTSRVFAVGKQTELFKIGQSIQDVETSKTPLQLQIKSFVRSMVLVGSIAFIMVCAINYYLSHDFFHALLQGLTLAMSVLPEEIPVAFSTFMALGAYHLYKTRVIAKSPYTVETLGAATVICLDKTGTITENKMELAAIYDFKNDITYDYTKVAYNFNDVLEYGLWASEVEPFDHMEKSIHKVYSEVAPKDKRPQFFLVHEYPLGGNPPMMTHVFSDKKSTHIIAVKGSVEGVLNQCKLSLKQKDSIQTKTKDFALKGFRVLAVGKSNRDINELPISQQEFEFDFIGLIAFYDPPKSNMKAILSKFYQAGIHVKMITGDYSETALSIANQINFKNNESVLVGKDVMAMDEKQLREQVKNVNIYARMFPKAKLKVIDALKANGEVVAMTGDGVNDAPALKAAHIGIAMGLRGSEVAKGAASLVLMDDDLAHMVDAVALGRRIYENLKKAIQYIISIHIPIILIVTLPLLFFWKYTDIFTPVHVIFLELIMGPTCSIVFENEPIEAGSMKKQPRKISASFFSFRELSLSIIQGTIITMACLSLGYYYMTQNTSESQVRTIIYATLIFSNLFLTLANRSFYYSILTTIQYKNKLVALILGISLIVLFLSLYQPTIRNIFEFEPLTSTQVTLCFIVASLGVLWIEFYKLINRKKRPLVL